MATEKQYGVTPAFSSDPPNARDLKLNDMLMTEFKAQNNFAPQSDTEKREAILKKMEGLLQQLVQLVGKKKGLPAGILDSAGGKVFTYGSYRLGVYGPNSDIDTLCVAPKHVTREDYFEHMPEILRNAWTDEELTSLVPVPGIGTPIIKLTVQGVDIDLIFSNLQVSSVPPDLNLTDDNLLRGLDETDRKCVNGTRVAQRVLELVPQTKPFRLALRAIKLWAQRRAIYGNVYGYPGGIAYAILVARVCQLYPKAAAPTLISKFFFIVKRWNWPKPVFLQSKEETSLQLREWDPSNYRGDAAHLMPILTPSYPSMNTAHTIGQSTKMVIMRELDRGEQIVNDIHDGKKQWKDLFQRHAFFTDSYKHYITIITAAKTKQAHDNWAGLVHSKAKRLVADIEHSDAKSVELVQLFNKGFERVHECRSPEDIEKTLEGDLSCQVQATKTTEETNDPTMQGSAQTETDGGEVPAMNGDVQSEERGPQKVWTTTYYLGIGLKKGATGLDISMPVKNFSGDCTTWKDYNPDLHSIKIKHIRNFALPPDLFVDGETPPARPKKKSVPVQKGAEAPNNKRSFSDTGLDANADPAKRRQSANAASTPNGVTARPNGASG
ncbi:hypothetical protein LTR36_003463 [Oleoguttula mirabilis]|uniref:Poly(A) polymerase n=1 Tax=Oleoguttula mirabilis TaxID=1507867 RepID=A0AAV9JJE6_9PEZI|nr:hypothetical protein LTR36_003463 [Oleoguttula mirabilis]